MGAVIKLNKRKKKMKIVEYSLDELVKKLLHKDGEEIVHWQIQLGKPYLDGQKTKLVVKYKELDKK